MNRMPFVSAIVFVAVFVGVPCLYAQTSPIYVGLVSVTPTNTPILSAVEGGYFKKYGLDVKPLVMSGSSTALAALLSGAMSFITIAGSGVIKAPIAGGAAGVSAGAGDNGPY